MSIKVRDIKNYIEETAPRYLAEEWDNVGLLLGNQENEVKKAVVCLDVTRTVKDEAVKLNADLIISHHPLIFKGMKIINEDSPKGGIIYSLIKNNISVYSAHTNLDVADFGVNQQLAESIGLIGLKKLKDYKTDESSGKVYGMGIYGQLEQSLNLSAFITLIKNKLSVEKIRLVGDINREIKTVAVFCGSFDEDYGSVMKSKADVLLTGDLKYHTASDMKELGLCVIDAGHFNTEKLIIPSLVKRLRIAFPQIEFIASTMEVDPFIFI